MHHIRLIQESDIPGFRAALDSVVRERRYLAFLETPPLASTTEFVLSNIREGIPQYVALVEEKVVGFCDICPQTSRPVFKHSGRLGMGIVAEHRGKGIGRALVLTTIDHAKRFGLSRIELEVFTSNEPAICLYKSVGFEIEGTKRQHANFGDRFEDSYVMALLLPMAVE